MSFVDIVFEEKGDGPMDLYFIEVEDPTGKSIRFGEWVKRLDGYWVLRIRQPENTQT